MFKIGQDVRVSHEGDKDDGQYGTVEEINGTKYRIWFGDAGGWYGEDELVAA